MTQEHIKTYFNKILPHYKAMAENPKVQKINAKIPQSFFCTQWGESFDRGILFVGRATNGWGTGIDPSSLLDDGIFNGSDQMQWIDDVWFENKDKKGNKLWTGNHSPFWRLIRRVTEHYHKELWYSHIAWSNLAKCAPSARGNPSNSLWYATLEQNIELLKIDIEMLNPKIIVMITGGWENEIIKSIVGETPCLKTESFGHTIKTWLVADRLIIACERPEGRPEDSLTKCICAAINEFNLCFKKDDVPCKIYGG